MNQPLIIIGAGGHSKVLIDTLQNQTANILGITDIDITRHNKRLLGIPIIGDDQEVFKYSSKLLYLINGLGKIDRSKHRQEVFQYFKQHGYSFSQVIHRSAIISSHAELSEGVQILAGAIVQAGSVIGVNSIINTGSKLDHDILIGAHVHIAPGVTLSGGVEIDDGTLIGSGTTVIQGIHVGANSIIGAGSVVVKDVPDETIVMGVPAREVNE